MYRKQDSLEQGLVTPPLPADCTATARRKMFSNNFRPELARHGQPPPHFPSLPPHPLNHSPPRHPPPPPLRLPGDSGGGCLARTPFTSLCAFLCCLFGVLLFATMMAWAFTASVEQARRALRVSNLPWLDKVHLLFLVSACAMVAVSLAFLLIGLLSTGPTRHAVFNSAGGGRPLRDGEAAATAARRGGRISCVVAICLSFVLNLLWTAIAIVTAILCFIYTILFLLCSSANDCLDFGTFGPLFNRENNSLKFCGGELQQFCAVTNTVIVWYFVGLLGSLIVCVGLVQFSASNAANYAHIGSEAKYAELSQLFYSEINEMEEDNRRHQQHNHHQQQHQQQSWRRQSTATNRRDSNIGNNNRCWEETEKAEQNGHRALKQPPPPPPPYEYQRRSKKNERRAEKRSVGATLASVRRNSYQTSLHGSNNWLNCYADGTATAAAVVADHRHNQAVQPQQHYAVGRVAY
ncbi:hypothetical protein niasHT_013775 [Heterodera trifolii]|uniref:Uncharacterized protein n=1 Tax=Heterodera trifolii TaxID=157864 RepID=A0ABD2KTG5_9BILA